MYIYIVKVSTNYTLTYEGPSLSFFQACNKPSPYPLAPRAAQPPPAGALARWRGEMAGTDPDSGCGRTAGGSGAAQKLQRRPDSSSRPPNATVLTCEHGAARGVFGKDSHLLLHIPTLFPASTHRHCDRGWKCKAWEPFLWSEMYCSPKIAPS